jgi:hypothetical protein
LAARAAATTSARWVWGSPTRSTNRLCRSTSVNHTGPGAASQLGSAHETQRHTIGSAGPIAAPAAVAGHLPRTPSTVLDPAAERCPAATHLSPGHAKSPRARPTTGEAPTGSAQAPAPSAAAAPPGRSRNKTEAPPDPAAKTLPPPRQAPRPVPSPEPTTAPHALLDPTPSIEAHVAFTP